MNEASQELDVTGREFLSSPAIPSVDGIQTLFGDILFRNHQLCLPGENQPNPHIGSPDFTHIIVQIPFHLSRMPNVLGVLLISCLFDTITTT